MSDLYLIVWFGNPGQKYAQTRHNVGFLFVDFLHQKYSPEATWQEGYKWLWCRIKIENKDIILLKPQTYMNLLGQSIQRCTHFFKIPTENTLLITDDIDMEFGKIRYRSTGSAGGHNGIKSAIQYLGTNDIARIKIGIGRHPHMSPSDWVLSRFEKEEQEELEQVFEEVERKIK